MSTPPGHTPFNADNAVVAAFWRFDGQVVTVQIAGVSGLVKGTVAMQPDQLPTLLTGDGTQVLVHPRHVVLVIPGIVDLRPIMGQAEPAQTGA